MSISLFKETSPGLNSEEEVSELNKLGIKKPTLTHYNCDLLADPHTKMFQIHYAEETYRKWYDIWNEMDERSRTETALVRAMECTNGCVQEAWRATQGGYEIPTLGGPLSTEATRECMNLSMRTINRKELVFLDGETKLIFSPATAKLMEKARLLYRFMKTPEGVDDGADIEFNSLSCAHFHVLGKARLIKAFDTLRLHFTTLFTEEFIKKGEEYVYWHVHPQEWRGMEKPPLFP